MRPREVLAEASTPSPPPEGVHSWEAAVDAWGVPEEKWNSASAVVDPDGKHPRLFFQQVPEQKSGKNRVHLDLYVSAGPTASPEDRKAAIEPEAARLAGLGAERVEAHLKRNEYFVVMREPRQRFLRC